MAEFKFISEQQRTFYYATERNQVFSGGFNNGKTYIACLKLLTLLSTFPGYRAAIGRQFYSDLKKTTMQTFMSICPPDFIDSHNEQDGITVFTNGSVVLWLHLDKVDRNTLRGLEINAILVDQAEEMKENVFDVLDARLGRWSGAIVPPQLVNPDWPVNSLTGKPIVPSYHMLLANPEDEFHFIYRKFHPESEERIEGTFFIEAEWVAELGSKESYNAALKKDSEYVDKYIKGKWGASSSAIHKVSSTCYLEYDSILIDKIKNRGKLVRVMDHGDSAPTCCLWWAAIDGVYICYREYYMPSRPISYHRQAIHDLTGDEYISADYADPAIFKKGSQKSGAFWSVSDEYLTNDIAAPPITWLPADNNEFATRNRINELLAPNFKHPVTREPNSPGIYFIRASADYPNGCRESIRQLSAQKKHSLGSIDGKNYYSDDRDESVTDHAYDCIRYFVAMHSSQPTQERRRPPRNSFAYYEALKMRRQAATALSAA